MGFKRYAIITLILPLFMAQNALANDDREFEQFLKQQQGEFSQFQQQHLKEFEDFVKAWKQAENEYKQAISLKWQKVELPSKKIWVSYSEDLNTRTSIDYDKGTVKVEFRNPSAYSSKSSDVKTNNLEINKAKVELNKLANQTPMQALKSDPVYIRTTEQITYNTKAHSDTQESASHLLAPIMVKKLIETQQPKVDVQPEVTSIVYRLPKQSLPQKAKPFLSEVHKQAKRWNIDPALLLAVIHTESSFNPMARSPIPAFGLMQIVPSTAGKDVSALLHGEPLLLSPDYLYQPQNNIEAGSAYLHILNKRYFKSVRNEQSRKYLCIAAYNTGAGNVAKTLTGTKSLSRAAIAANLMSPEQIHRKLLRDLPANETRNYLKKVLQRSDDYQQSIKGI